MAACIVNKGKLGSPGSGKQYHLHCNKQPCLKFKFTSQSISGNDDLKN